MIWHIFAHENVDDNFPIADVTDGKMVHIDLSGVDRKTGVHHNLAGTFDTYGTYPSEVATDLLKLSMGVFTADKSADRNQAYNRWSRYFHLYSPVINLDLWISVKDKIEQALNFLTGDHWEIHFRQAANGNTISVKQSQAHLIDLAQQPAAVALMSGGLDSFAGAIDLLETASTNAVFVSHYSRGGVTKTVQDRIYTLLRRHYPDRFCHLQFFVQPAEGTTGEIEPSQRSRSFLFLSLGVAVSTASGAAIPLHVYENGLLSLNVPLSANRGGGLSTRTTHPYFLFMYQNILDSLGIPTRIISPFRFLTKGEMLLASKNRMVLQEGTKIAHSCSHPTYVRFKGKTTNDHCGYCLPCMVRRAATSLAGLDDVNYVVNIIEDAPPSNRVEGKDLFALKIALQRLETMKSSLISNIRTAGPLPGTQEEIPQYVDVYKRGMAELKRLFT